MMQYMMMGRCIHELDTANQLFFSRTLHHCLIRSEPGHCMKLTAQISSHKQMVMEVGGHTEEEKKRHLQKDRQCFFWEFRKTRLRCFSVIPSSLCSTRVHVAPITSDVTESKLESDPVASSGKLSILTKNKQQRQLGWKPSSATATSPRTDSFPSIVRQVTDCEWFQTYHFRADIVLL